MPNMYLHGNGQHCPACALRRKEQERRIGYMPLRVTCNNCGGSGRIPKPIAQIVAEQVAEARKYHWKLEELSK
ncbi:hypothetical protein [Shimia sp.]|uniref:hypothetical protein n=1 Tax=Shimia sp. TaxID=1954381 RepID=UPI003B8D402E